MIVGTAGHVDHGKTTLVRALTGVDTDRLPEEKARGISIALGYAYAALANGEVLGFVDVPGHERFLPTMVAGATGIDFALLVVAADDGVMPQTREHLDIIGLLGVRSGAIALSKVDTVDAPRLAAVRAAIAALVAETPLAGCPLFEVAAPSGRGIDALRDHLAAQAAGLRRTQDDGHFRLAVDRSFTLAGIGTIVTGTVHAGSIAVGDPVALAPGGTRARVRSIHAHDRPSASGVAGQRCALNLAGLARDQVQRGDWIVAPPAVLATQRLDARFTLLPGEPQALRSGTAVRVHLGAAHVGARIVMIGAADAPAGSVVEPGQTAIVQLVLEQAIAAWHGDRFIVRDAAARRTLGGGRVLDPFAPARYRRTPARRAALAALAAESPALRLRALLEQSVQGIDLQRFALAGNIRDVQPLLAQSEVRRVHLGGEDFAVGLAQWHALQASAETALAHFHEQHPDEAGPDRARLRRMAFARLPAPLYAALMGELIEAGRVCTAGPWLHRPGHRSAPTAAETALLEDLLPRLAASPFDPPWVRDLAAQTGQGEAAVRAALLRGAQRGEAYQVVRDLFYHPAAIDRLAELVRRLQQTHGQVLAARFRDETGLGRKRAIQVLEFFDRIGLLRRVRDHHLVRPDDELELGRSAPAGGTRGGSQIPLEADPPGFLAPAAVSSKLETAKMQQN
jgi:selenocysteine-specific elongation factor